MRTPIRLKKNKTRKLILWNYCSTFGLIFMVVSQTLRSLILIRNTEHFPIFLFFSLSTMIPFVVFMMVGCLYFYRLHTRIRFELDLEGFYCIVPNLFSERHVFAPWNEEFVTGRVWSFPFYCIRNKKMYNNGFFRQDDMACLVPPRDWIENIDEVDDALSNVHSNKIKTILESSPRN